MGRPSKEARQTVKVSVAETKYLRRVIGVNIYRKGTATNDRVSEVSHIKYNLQEEFIENIQIW